MNSSLRSSRLGISVASETAGFLCRNSTASINGLVMEPNTCPNNMSVSVVFDRDCKESSTSVWVERVTMELSTQADELTAVLNKTMINVHVTISALSSDDFFHVFANCNGKGSHRLPAERSKLVKRFFCIQRHCPSCLTVRQGNGNCTSH